MSTHNPLNEYNSYSYHHFIVIADTSERAETIANDPEAFFQLIRSDVETPGLAVLVNPMKSNKLIIQDISWSNVMNSDSGSRINSNAVNAHTDGKMTLLEPLGVRFFNKLYDIYNKFGTSSGGMTAVWVIKTIFVGYRNVPEDGQPEYISNIKPLIIFPTEFLAEFTEAGGRYDIQFVEANNGAGSTRVSNSTALPGGTVNLGGKTATTESVTLSTAMLSLQNHIEENYENNYKKVAEAQSKAANPTMREVTPSKMQYRIQLHTKLQDGSFVMECPPQLSAGGNGKVPYLNTSQSERLDQAIEKILLMCPKVLELLRTGDASGAKWMPYIRSSTQTLDPAQNSGVSSRITFFVGMRKVLTQFDATAPAEKTEEVKTAQGTETKIVDNADSNKASTEASALKLDAVDASSYLEYDYTYTGKNVDVLTYDMRMNMATGFFQMLIAPSGVVKTGQIPAANGAQTASSSQTLGKPGNVAAMPNVAISNSGAALNSSNPQGVSMYQDMYRKWVQTETVSVNMRIRGNPLLMDSLTVTTADLERAMTDDPVVGVAANWMNGPIVVKVNVRMPVEDQPNVYEPFWYDGFYRVLGVKTAFSSGEFTQDLELIAMTDNSYTPVDDNNAPRPRGKMPSQEDLTAFAADAEPVGERLPIQTLHISSNGIKMIKTFESFAAKKYPDNGKFAIGYGHNFTDAEKSSGIINLPSGQVIIANGITESQADELLRIDVKKIAEDYIHNRVRVNLYQKEYDVLCSMAYNLGAGGVLGSDSTLLRLLNQQQYSQIPAQILRWDKWTRNGKPEVNPGLVTRRKLESQHWGTVA